MFQHRTPAQAQAVLLAAQSAGDVHLAERFSRQGCTARRLRSGRTPSRCWVSATCIQVAVPVSHEMPALPKSAPRAGPLIVLLNT